MCWKWIMIYALQNVFVSYVMNKSLCLLCDLVWDALWFGVRCLTLALWPGVRSLILSLWFGIRNLILVIWFGIRCPLLALWYGIGRHIIHNVNWWYSLNVLRLLRTACISTMKYWWHFSWGEGYNFKMSEITWYNLC